MGFLDVLFEFREGVETERGLAVRNGADPFRLRQKSCEEVRTQFRLLRLIVDSLYLYYTRFPRAAKYASNPPNEVRWGMFQQ